MPSLRATSKETWENCVVSLVEMHSKKSPFQRWTLGQQGTRQHFHDLLLFSWLYTVGAGSINDVALQATQIHRLRHHWICHVADNKSPRFPQSNPNFPLRRHFGWSYTSPLEETWELREVNFHNWLELIGNENPSFGRKKKVASVQVLSVWRGLSYLKFRPRLKKHGGSKSTTAGLRLPSIINNSAEIFNWCKKWRQQPLPFYERNRKYMREESTRQTIALVHLRSRATAAAAEMLPLWYMILGAGFSILTVTGNGMVVFLIVTECVWNWPHDHHGVCSWEYLLCCSESIAWKGNTNATAGFQPRRGKPSWRVNTKGTKLGRENSRSCSWSVYDQLHERTDVVGFIPVPQKRAHK